MGPGGVFTIWENELQKGRRGERKSGGGLSGERATFATDGSLQKQMGRGGSKVLFNGIRRWHTGKESKEC